MSPINHFICVPGKDSVNNPIFMLIHSPILKDRLNEVHLGSEIRKTQRYIELVHNLSIAAQIV
jgi:hypothetical protein